MNEGGVHHQNATKVMTVFFQEVFSTSVEECAVMKE
jgi:hypothetical protein